MLARMLGHYRVLERIGAGGMGEVYRARDEHLGRDVAIKILPPDALTHPAARRRFRREAQAISRLNHPNIATIYEFDTQDDVDFLVMELLPGVTLADKLRSGPLPATEAASLCAQILSGLEEAHARGLVHRDLKPENIVVTPKGQAKILDFGLAKSLLPPDTNVTTESIAGSPTLEGTLPYMAPEQILGGKADARTDLHAVGAILYEMTTGVRPFAHTETAPLIHAILNQPPPMTTPGGEAIAPDIVRVIAKAMAKNPDERYPSANAMLADLAGRPEPSTTAGPPRRSAAPLVMATAVVLLVTGAALGFLYFRKAGTPTPRAGTGVAGVPGKPERPLLAVVGFKNLSGNPGAGWLATAFAEMISTELAAGERVRIVAAENVARMRRELALQDADSYARATLRRIRSNLGSDLLVAGAYTALGREAGGRLRLDVRLQDNATGETLVAASETGDEANLFDLVSRIGRRLRAVLGVGDVSAAELPAIRAAMPSNAEAMRAYTDGLARLRRLEFQAARALLQEAVAADTTFALGHAALARAWAALGYDARALEEARRARDHAAGLPREDRLVVEADYWSTAKQTDRAIESLATLRTLFPDNLEYALKLASVQYGASMVEEVRATLDAMRALPPPTSEDPRIDLLEATMDGVQKERRVELAKAALDKAHRQGARLLAARAHVALGNSLRALGRFDDARASLHEAKSIYSATGDQPGLAYAQFWSAGLYQVAGDKNRAIQELREALVTFRAVGNRRGIASSENDLANILKERGDLEGAKHSFEECVKLFHEIGATGGEAVSLGNVAGVLRYQGDLAGARRYYQETLAIERRMGRESGVSWCLSGIAHLDYMGGRLDEATRMYEQAAQACARSGEKECDEEVTGGIALVWKARGDFAAARRRYEDVLAAAGEAASQNLRQSIQLGLAGLLNAEGRPKDAETPARAAADRSHQEGATADEASALTVLAEALMAQNRPSEAAVVTRRAVALAQETNIVEIELAVAISHARALAATGRPREAESLLTSAVATAQRQGFVTSALEARLALAEVQVDVGKRATGRALLARVAKDAGARGFSVIARRAEVRLTSSRSS